jgi:DNA-directed RNA polymerase subunit omega
MARITVEDCLDHVDNRNRFHLSLMASRRARQLRAGAHPLVQSEEDDYTVLALREMATGQVTPEFLDKIDHELEGPAADEGEVTADSVAEAAEALGAGMAAGMGEPAAPEAESEESDEAAEEAAPEEPDIQHESELDEAAEDGAGEDEAGDEEPPEEEAP